MLSLYGHRPYGRCDCVDKMATELNEKDFLTDHGCATADEYDRKRFEEWVCLMEEAFGEADGMAGRTSEEVDFKEVEHTKDLVKSLKKVLT